MVYFHLFVAWSRSRSLFSSDGPLVRNETSSENLSRNRLSRGDYSRGGCRLRARTLKRARGRLVVVPSRAKKRRFETETIFDYSSFEIFIRLERERERERERKTYLSLETFPSPSSLVQASRVFDGGRVEYFEAWIGMDSFSSCVDDVLRGERERERGEESFAFPNGVLEGLFRVKKITRSVI